MKIKRYILIGLFVPLIILSGITFVHVVEPYPECPARYEWSEMDQKCIITPKPVEPGEEPEQFSPNIAVWFNVGVTENQAKNLIESFGLTKYKLSDPIVWEGGKGTDIGGMAVIEVSQGSAQEYIQKFKESDIVKTADLNIVYEPGEENGRQRGYDNTILIVGIIVGIVFVFFLIWYRFLRK